MIVSKNKNLSLGRIINYFSVWKFFQTIFIYFIKLLREIKKKKYYVRRGLGEILYYFIRKRKAGMKIAKIIFM